MGTSAQILTGSLGKGAPWLIVDDSHVGLIACARRWDGIVGIGWIAAGRMLVRVLHHLALDDEVAQGLGQLIHPDAEHLLWQARWSPAGHAACIHQAVRHTGGQHRNVRDARRHAGDVAILGVIAIQARLQGTARIQYAEQNGHAALRIFVKNWRRYDPRVAGNALGRVVGWRAAHGPTTTGCRGCRQTTTGCCRDRGRRKAIHWM